MKTPPQSRFAPLAQVPPIVCFVSFVSFPFRFFSFPCPHQDAQDDHQNNHQECQDHPQNDHQDSPPAKKEYEYIYDIWENETNRDRSWVPWDWCETVKTIKTNNTIVVFPPTHKTLHAVKLDYPHNDFQRTQIYGNLMYTSRPKLKKENYRDLIK